MDGENCWESYANDGGEFLDTLYGLLEGDDSIETVLMSEYLSKANHPIILEDIKSGSWINKNFDLWIGEPVKNLAWKYLENARETYSQRSKIIKDKKQLQDALEEIHIAQGSDWLWWYGEPNESGQDHIFDHLFRVHLKNMYEKLGLEHPRYLDIPLISIIGKPIRHPRRYITPVIDGRAIKDDEGDNINNWSDAGYIFLPDNPTSSVGKAVKGIYFGNDRENLYFKFEINKNYIKNEQNFANQIYIYVRVQNANNLSPIRIISKTKNMFPIVKNRFSHEIEISIKEKELAAPRFSRAISGGLWVLDILKKISLAYKDTLEVAISLKDLGIEQDEGIEFFIISGHHDIIDEVYPQDLLLTLHS
jgi:alpha-amylase/alpha-mannosidase (GH57 family)